MGGKDKKDPEKRHKKKDKSEKKKKKKKDKDAEAGLAKFFPGSQAWVKSEKGDWSLVNVISRHGKSMIKVEPEDESSGSYKIDLDESKGTVFPANRSVVPDMTNLQFFHIPGIMFNLKQRSLSDEPYTFLSGSVLVAVNPLKRLHDPEGILGSPQAVMCPHPYAIAENAYQQLVFNAKRKDDSDTVVDQSIVVGGESGAGKTESSKYVLNHLVQRSANEETKKKDRDLDQRLMESNPILEAFGNAATKRNHNSSRFGKFMKLHFTKPGKKNKKPMVIFGASVKTYLLERSRVTYHVEGERTYHVFYQLVHGASKKLRKKLKLDSEFDLLKPKSASGGHGPVRKNKEDKQLSKLSSNLPQPEDDKKAFKALCEALTTIGVSVGDGGAGSDSDSDSEESQGLFPALAALLHLGNVTFADKDSSEGSVAAVKDNKPLETAAKLLDVKVSKLEKVFSEHTVKTVNEKLVKKRDARGAKYALNAIVKFLYSGIFDWLVSKITESLSESGPLEDLPFIGVLDIFGFETFAVNDFEQLLINFTNEALQSCFNEQIFQAEAQLYEREGLLVEEDSRQMPPNNLECMALLQGGDSGDAVGTKLGILGMIDSEGKGPQPNDDKLNSNLHRTFKNNPFFPTPHPKDARSCFIVRHYAGDVKYTVGSFLEKNVDSLPGEVAKAFKDSNLSIISDIFSNAKLGEDDNEGGSRRKKKKASDSVTAKFKKQMSDLITDLNATRCSFIRCIKPNARMMREDKKDRSWFDEGYILPQLVNLSIPQTAEVLKGGLPTRIEFQSFTDSYKDLLPREALHMWKTLGKKDERLFVKALFYAFEIPPDSYKIGRTRVFFKSGMLDKVNEMLAGALSGSSLDDAVVERFKESFTRALWRQFFVNIVVFKNFVDILAESRKGRAASIMQRFARRKLAELEMKEELARAKREKEERELEEALEKSKKAKRKSKRLAKAKETATGEERRRLEAEEALANMEAEELDRRAKHQSLRLGEERFREKKLRESIRVMSSRFGESRSKAPLRLLEDKRKSFRKSLAVDFRKKKTIQEEDEEDDDDEEDDRPYICDQVRFNLCQAPPQPKPPARGAAGRGRHLERGKSESKMTLRNVLCFSKMFQFSSSKRRMSEPSYSTASSADIEEQKAFDRADWPDCLLFIVGYQIRVFEDGETNEKGELVGKGKPLLVFQINEDLAVKRDDGNGFSGGTDPRLVTLTVRNQDLIEFAFEDNWDCDQFRYSFERARSRYDFEVLQAEKLGMGQFKAEASKEMKMFQKLYKEKIITKEELEIALMQQVTTEVEHLDDLVGTYGEEAYPDFKTKCPDCSEYFFNLPTDPVLRCPTCGCDQIETPKILEEEARIARMRMEQERIHGFAKGGKQTELPMFRKIGSEKFHFEPLVLKDSLDADQTRTIYTYTLPWHRQVGDDPWEDFLVVATWEDFKAFFETEIFAEGKLTKHQERAVPVFPNDDESADSHDERAENRIPILTVYLVKFLNVYFDEGLFQYPFVRRFLGLPL